MWSDELIIEADIVSFHLFLKMVVVIRRLKEPGQFNVVGCRKAEDARAVQAL